MTGSAFTDGDDIGVGVGAGAAASRGFGRNLILGGLAGFGAGDARRVSSWMPERCIFPITALRETGAAYSSESADAISDDE